MPRNENTNNLTNLFQLSLLTTKDIKQEIKNLIQFKKEKTMNELNNSHSRDLEELKNKINSLKLEIQKLKKLVGKR